MKSLLRILTAVLYCAPLCNALAAGPVATTAGSNLTAFNPSNVNNNQWATMSNGRYDGNVSAKADFGNCNALILRCATPKCANGGCSDMSVASAIVEGCVKSNSSCKQYGNDLVQYMSAQLVANSNAKINEQNAAAAAAAANAASAQSQQQLQQMQQQMAQMQQQMIQQQQENAAQLQEALAAQQAQSAAALSDMKSAATAAAMENEAGISAYQQDAIDRGVSVDVLERQKITGQIMTEIENAETSLATARKVMNTAFDYAHCDSRGNNCDGPKRIKKWRELAREFVEPYDNTIDKIYDALMIAQTVGVDLSQIYLMLNNTCNTWGEYLCPQMNGGQISYNFDDADSKSVPKVCDAKGENCHNCSMLKLLTNNEEVYESWINTETSTDKGNVSVVACASGALNSSNLFARRAKRKNGANLVDIEFLDNWLSQTEPGYKSSTSTASEIMKKYCAVDDSDILETATLSKTVDVKKSPLCVSELGGAKAVSSEDDGCPYINPVYGICDTHPYNAGIKKIGAQSSVSEDINKTKNVVALKITVISQQMYKQYEYLSATLRRLKTQLEKSVLTANLEAAGGQYAGAAGSASKLKDKKYQDCVDAADKTAQKVCFDKNYEDLYDQIIKKEKCQDNEKRQLRRDVNLLEAIIGGAKIKAKFGSTSLKGCEEITSRDGCEKCLNVYYSYRIMFNE